MIYQLVNKRTKILAIVIFHKAHLCNWYNRGFALLIFMPRFNSINFYQNKPNWLLSYFYQKKQTFRALGLRPQVPVPRVCIKKKYCISM